MQVKTFKSISDQIDLLKKRRILVLDEEYATRKLMEINYYRFIGYALPFKDSNSDLYKENISFNDIIKIYEFDQELRILLFKYISIIDIKNYI